MLLKYIKQSSRKTSRTKTLKQETEKEAEIEEKRQDQKIEVIEMFMFKILWN